MSETHIAVIQLMIAYTLVGAFIFTVIVTCLSLVGWIRFANQNQQKRLFQVLIVELVVICVTFFGGLIKFNPRLVAQTAAAEEANRVKLTVNVLDLRENKGVEGARVLLRAGDKVDTATTNGAGTFTFSIDRSLSGQPLSLTVTKQGYRDAITEQVVPSRDGVILSTLQPTNPTPITLPASAPTRLSEVQVFSSGPKESGSLANFSNWYELCSAPLPAGSVIEQVAFTLSGDRSCGAWAQCRETDRTPGRVCWQFRMQGHNEWLPPGQARSEGNLRVQFSRPGN